MAHKSILYAWISNFCRILSIFPLKHPIPEPERTKKGAEAPFSENPVARNSGSLLELIQDGRIL